MLLFESRIKILKNCEMGMLIVSVIFSYKSRKLILRNRRLVAKYFQLFAGLGSAASISCWGKQKK